MQLVLQPSKFAEILEKTWRVSVKLWHTFMIMKNWYMINYNTKVTLKTRTLKEELYAKFWSFRYIAMTCE